MTTHYFDRVRQAPSTYVDSHDGALTDVRMCVARVGEDANKVLDAFWREHRGGSFSVIPLFAVGNAPRKELCSARSLTSALQTLGELDAGSAIEQQWRAACEAHAVAWPKRFQPKPEPAAKPIAASANIEPGQRTMTARSLG
jgi:hypothetical protein